MGLCYWLVVPKQVAGTTQSDSQASSASLSGNFPYGEEKKQSWNSLNITQVLEHNVST